MGELLVQLFLGLAELFSGLFPERFKESARTGPTWRRIIAAIFIGLGSLLVGLVVAALLFAVAAVIWGFLAAIAGHF